MNETAGITSPTNRQNRNSTAGKQPATPALSLLWAGRRVLSAKFGGCKETDGQKRANKGAAEDTRVGAPAKG